MKTVLQPFKASIWLSMLLWSVMLAGLTTGITSCVGARFDQTALENANMLSEKLPALMDKAIKPFKDNETEVNALIKSLNDAYDRANATKKNKEVAEQWRIVRDDMVKPFMDRWKEKGKLDKDFIKAATTQVKDSLAAIARAEKAKPR